MKCKYCGIEINLEILGSPTDICWDCLSTIDKDNILDINLDINLEQKQKNLIYLKELREKIFKEQFWEWDYDGGCEKANDVLKQIEKINENPILLDYILNCLSSHNIELKEYYYIIVHKKHHAKIYDNMINKIFNSKEEAENYACNENFPNNLLFEKYSIKIIKPNN